MSINNRKQSSEFNLPEHSVCAAGICCKQAARQIHWALKTVLFCSKDVCGLPGRHSGHKSSLFSDRDFSKGMQLIFFFAWGRVVRRGQKVLMGGGLGPLNLPIFETLYYLN